MALMPFNVIFFMPFVYKIRYITTVHICVYAKRKIWRRKKLSQLFHLEKSLRGNHKMLHSLFVWLTLARLFFFYLFLFLFTVYLSILTVTGGRRYVHKYF